MTSPTILDQNNRNARILKNDNMDIKIRENNIHTTGQVINLQIWKH